MILGVFPFMIDTMAYDKLERSYEYKWASQDRLPHPLLKKIGVGGPALQYFGPGAQTISINGTIYPGQAGMKSSLVLLRWLAELGKPYLLVTSEGKIMGWWVIKSISETSSEYKKSVGLPFLGTVVPRKVEFNMTLQRFIDFKKDAVIEGVQKAIAVASTTANIASKML